MDAAHGLEGMKLLMTSAEAAAVCERRGWTHTITGADGRFTANPSAPAKAMRLKFEHDRLLVIEVDYVPPAPERARAQAAGLPVQRSVRILGSPAWGAFSDDHSIAIVGEGDGSSATAVHLGLLSDRREVESIASTYGGVAPPERN